MSERCNVCGNPLFIRLNNETDRVDKETGVCLGCRIDMAENAREAKRVWYVVDDESREKSKRREG